MDSVINHLSYPLLHQQSTGSNKRGDNLLDLIYWHLIQLLARIILYKLWTSEKAAFFYLTCGTCEENVQNTMFWKLLWTDGEKILVCNCQTMAQRWIEPPMQISMNTVSGVCQITLQTWLEHSTAHILGGISYFTFLLHYFLLLCHKYTVESIKCLLRCSWQRSQELHLGIFTTSWR